MSTDSVSPHLHGVHIAVDARPHVDAHPPAYTIDVTARPHGTTATTGFGGLPPNVHLGGIGIRNPNTLYNSNYITWGSGSDAPRYKLIIRNRAGRVLAANQATWDRIKAEHMQVLGDVQAANPHFTPRSVQKAVFKLNERTVEADLTDSSDSTDETVHSERPTTKQNFPIPASASARFDHYKATIPAHMQIAESCMAIDPPLDSSTRGRTSSSPSRTPPPVLPPVQGTFETLTNHSALLEGNHLIDSMNAIKFAENQAGRTFNFFSLDKRTATLTDQTLGQFRLPPPDQQHGKYAIPIRTSGNHWVMVLLDFDNHKIEYYDPKGVPLATRGTDGQMSSVRPEICQFIIALGAVLSSQNRAWRVENDRPENHQPTDDIQCGAHICDYAEQRSQGVTRDNYYTQKAGRPITAYRDSLAQRIGRFNRTLNTQVWLDNPRLVQRVLTDPTQGVARRQFLAQVPAQRYPSIASAATLTVRSTNTHNTRFFVRDIPCTDLARELYGTSQADIPYLVSFGNKGDTPDHRGGGVKRGANAQEECLWRETTTGFTLDDSLTGTGYANTPELQALATPGLYNGGGIPETGGLYNRAYIVRKSKEDGYEPLAAPVPVAIGTVAAIRHPNPVDRLTPPQRERMKRDIYTQLEMARDKGHTRVIAGAYGCGAFGNPPAEIAALYKEVIDQYFRDCFTEVHFAIISDAHDRQHNFETFAQSFATDPTIGDRVRIQDRPGTENARGALIRGRVQRMQAMAASGVVDFYDRKKPLTQVFGNYFESPITITISGRQYTFRCAEAAYQAGKFANNPAHLQALTRLDGPAAYQFGVDHAAETIPGWITPANTTTAATFGSNLRWMQSVQIAKYQQDPHARQLLLATGNAYLVEHNPVKGRDTVWSDDSDGTGQNTLGQILMALRGMLGGTGAVARPGTCLTTIQGREGVAGSYNSH